MISHSIRQGAAFCSSADTSSFDQDKPAAGQSGFELAGSLAAIRGVVFDLDDTLFDEVDWVVSSIHAAAAALHLDPVRALQLAEEFINARGHAGEDIYNYILVGCGQSDSVRNICAMLTAVQSYRPAAASLSLFPGVREMLLWLQSRYSTGLLLNGDAGMQRAKASALGLEALIRHVICSSELAGGALRWPHELPLASICSVMQLKPEETLFVADNPFRDFRIANQAGLRTCRVLTGIYRDTAYPTKEYQAHYHLSSAAQLPALLRGGTGQLGLSGLESPRG